METRTRREPEARIPAYVMRSKAFARLARSPLAIHVYMILQAYGRKDRSRIGQRKLADLCGAWRGSVQTALTLLEEDGWISRSHNEREDGSNGVDSYRLTYPAEVEACRLQINARLDSDDDTPPKVTSPLYMKGDIFAWQSGIYVREARIPRSVLTSAQFRDLREHGRKLHAWMLLYAYAPGREAVSIRRLAKECHVSHPRIAEALTYLKAGGWVKDEPSNGRRAPVRTVHHPEPLDRVEPRRPKGEQAPAAEPEHQVEPEKTGEHQVELYERMLDAMDLIPHNRSAWFDYDLRLLKTASPERWVLECPSRFHKDWIADNYQGLIEHTLTALLEHPVSVDLVNAEDEGPEQGAESNPLTRMDHHEGAVWLVQAFHAAMRGAQDYSPTPAELRIARGLIVEHGPLAKTIVEGAVTRMRATRFAAGNFASVSRYVSEVLASLR